MGLASNELVNILAQHLHTTSCRLPHSLFSERKFATIFAYVGWWRGVMKQNAFCFRKILNCYLFCHPSHQNQFGCQLFEAQQRTILLSTYLSLVN